jgi:hypothetical protein
MLLHRRARRRAKRVASRERAGFVVSLVPGVQAQDGLKLRGKFLRRVSRAGELFVDLVSRTRVPAEIVLTYRSYLSYIFTQSNVRHVCQRQPSVSGMPGSSGVKTRVNHTAAKGLRS